MDHKEPRKKSADKKPHKAKEQPEPLKGRSAGQKAAPSINSTTTPAQAGEPHVGPPTDHYSGQMATSGHTGTTPAMIPDAGKRDIREPEAPSRQEEIREPNPDEQEAAAGSRKESRKEAAVEENPPRDHEDGKEAA